MLIRGRKGSLRIDYFALQAYEIWGFFTDLT